MRRLTLNELSNIGGGGGSLLSQHPGMELYIFNPLSANFSKWSNTLKQFVGNLPTNFLSVFGHFVGLALKGLSSRVGKKAFFKENENKTM